MAASDVGLADIVHECKWYNYYNVDHITLNGKVPKKKWGIGKPKISHAISLFPRVNRRKRVEGSSDYEITSCTLNNVTCMGGT